MTLRELTPADAARCAELEEILFPEAPWTKAEFEYVIPDPRTRYIGVTDATGIVVGYAGLALLGPPDGLECEIHTIGVHPDHQGTGIARLMMDTYAAFADDHDAPIFLEVRTDNTPAISLYTSYGFVQTSIRKGYYESTGADAYTMCRPRLSER